MKLRWIDWLVIAIVGLIVAFILISIYGIVNSKGIELFSVTSPLIFPFLVGVTLLVCWILTIIKGIKNAVTTNKDDSKELLHDMVVAIIYIIGVLTYSLVIDKIGFILGSILFLITGMVFMNYDEEKYSKKIINAAIVSCITVPVLYYVFHEVFKVMLP
ncbi:tripartite tricarboxylate transporter TctB family protein [Sedimentibacter sp.]|uniref:tripartite tricarboxylate transporter TctB family protein n=1 Tax=Sedimentibacter sp. TaxID=1960295 RepID=UPI00289B935F|nr:tripartite tricarboxylate transporter TctB family protein [Sedimentibacter sp.]